jgi:hypothetical protein
MKEIDPFSTRYLCDILRDMRSAYETRNFSYLLGLIEELQYRAYRMENKIEQINDIKTLENQRVNLKREIKELREEKKKLKIEQNKELDRWED